MALNLVDEEQLRLLVEHGNPYHVLLAVDPGVAKIGWSVLRREVGYEAEVINMGLLSDKSDPKLPFNVRLNDQIQQLIGDFSSIIDSYHVNRVAWEIVPSFSTGYAMQARVLATATTLKVLTFEKNLPWTELSPQKWHKMLLGKAKDVKKPEVVSEVQRRFPQLDSLSFDEADSICIGLMALDCKEEEWKQYDKV
jgi:Holliday junction resolvasome RuvABC endonuclease subunit